MINRVEQAGTPTAATRPRAGSRARHETSFPKDGRRRVVIEGVAPEIDCGRFPIKRTIGERVEVGADIFADGHDMLAASLLYRPVGEAVWRHSPMTFLINDRWTGSFTVDSIGQWEYTLCAWVDRFATWRRDIGKKTDARQDVKTDLQIGVEMIARAAERADSRDEPLLRSTAEALANERAPQIERVRRVRSDDLARAMARTDDRTDAVTYSNALRVVVDAERARFSAWYELFPRSCASEPGEHGTFRDAERWLPYIASMGFDVVYLPPIHPIGRTNRKGKNNSVMCEPGDPGSPWAIGANEGGHKAVHPDLGTLDDFRQFAERANEHGLEVALDIAFQCSPDHPYAREHPEWFKHLPDGTIAYAENPPKKYEDIYPLYFECEAWESLWRELLDVFLFWIDQGVRIFRVDNPHTKPFRFWEWAIGEIKRRRPDAILLSEAFTRPKVMKRLAKLGFTQSYTYFAWKNTKADLTEYLTELTQTSAREYFRPNFWPNTPDILNEYLQIGGRPAFMLRAALAATASSNWGIYGPAFELYENTPREPGSEEYRDSEKYQIRRWNIDRPDSLRDYIARLNRVRREHPALQWNGSFHFHGIDNDQMLCYSKTDERGDEAILVVANLDSFHTQSGWTDLDLAALGVEADHAFQVHDLLTDARYIWRGSHNYVELDPRSSPVHVFRIRRRVRTEVDFEYYV